MSPSPSPGVVVDSVARSFGSVHAVRDASLEAPAGQVTALIGPNGSGKTTLLLMLASLLRPDAGTISIAGFDPVTQTEEVRARLGWMPDVLGSWNVLTVRSALETTGRLYRMTAAQSSRRASELIELVGLGPIADQPARVLSRGQKQKLSLARALVHDPEVLLLDEPASGLDPVARNDLQLLIRDLAARGTTVLISSHVLAELDEIADRAVYLEAGVTASADRVAAAQGTERPWRIRARDLPGLGGALVAAGVHPDDIRTDRDELIVPVAGEDAAAELLTRLVRAGVAISTFAPALGDLEHTFQGLARDTHRPTGSTR
ncbi:ABC transporter ATP-binding protein [Galbitalea soli]|uniref:ABC transporter ATP-binding protein n=1 Tax=Galbitalea soli TaxID=1268042 RepID=A0A7C9TR17_9MICO|nr:ABC transporter ATP-binding protein [Galbitalea soli]NEM90703.1 ABC transporter ATP-binding protein [Galbitalea soli]NYJ31421.1 ABC-type multidrug transport system ATPase subunit [Galbitalea soli]